MKILIWRSYGNTAVYAIDTEEQEQKVTELLVSCLEYYKADYSLIKKLNLTKLVRWIEEYCKGDDNFEEVKFTELVDFYK